jgi:hypothetical protein
MAEAGDQGQAQHLGPWLCELALGRASKPVPAGPKSCEAAARRPNLLLFSKDALRQIGP